MQISTHFIDAVPGSTLMVTDRPVASHVGDVRAAYPHIVARHISHAQKAVCSKYLTLSLHCFHIGRQLLLLLQWGKSREMSVSSRVLSHCHAPRDLKHIWNTSWKGRWKGFNTCHQHHNFRRHNHHHRHNPVESAPEGLMAGTECLQRRFCIVSVLHSLQEVNSESVSHWRLCQVPWRNEWRTYVTSNWSAWLGFKDTRLNVVDCRIAWLIGGFLAQSWGQ
jgi:hypothetical protein